MLEALGVERLRVVLEQDLAEPGDPAQRRAQVVRDRVAERLELLVRALELLVALLGPALELSGEPARLVLDLPALRAVVVDGDLEGTAQLGGPERLDQIAERLSRRRARERVVARVRAEKHD